MRALMLALLMFLLLLALAWPQVTRVPLNVIERIESQNAQDK